MNNSDKELEAKFFNIDKEALIRKLIELGAKDEGEIMLSDVSYTNLDGSWKNSNGDTKKLIRVRKKGDKTTLTFKERIDNSLTGTTEFEVNVNDAEKTKQIMEAIGLVVSRGQEKKRHTFNLNGVSIDIDTYPQVPPLVEIEGNSEEEIKEVVKLCGYNWEDAYFGDTNKLIEDTYGIPLGKYKLYGFDKIELREEI